MLHHLCLKKGAILGGFINSQSDNEICEVLNKRFSDEINPNDPQRRTYLNGLRDFFQRRERLFDPPRRLNRIFHRLARSVTGGRSVPKNLNSRLRWFHLLRRDLPPAVDQAIRDQLTAILSPATAANPAGAVAYVSFSTAHMPTTTGLQFELFDRNSSTPAVRTDANNKSYCPIILQCNVDQQLVLDPTEPDPPPDPGNETPIPFAKPAAKKKGTKKNKKKKTVKAKAAKKTKKAAKRK
jgi:hypothetical protein